MICLVRVLYAVYRQISICQFLCSVCSASGLKTRTAWAICIHISCRNWAWKWAISLSVSFPRQRKKMFLKLESEFKSQYLCSSLDSNLQQMRVLSSPVTINDSAKILMGFLFVLCPYWQCLQYWSWTLTGRAGGREGGKVSLHFKYTAVCLQLLLQ